MASPCRLGSNRLQARPGGAAAHPFYHPMMQLPHRHRPGLSSSCRGSALLAVMWVIALLTSLVATTMLLLREDVDTIETRRQMFRARMLAEQGLALAAHPDVKQDDEELLRHEVERGVGWIGGGR